jgi:hypothetical protein
VTRVEAQPPRNDYVFHVYVDPIRGDDTRAFQNNPGGTFANQLPLDPHFDSANTIRGLIQHAPYAFRTLTRTPMTGNTGALYYIATVFGSIPWTNPAPSAKRVSWVVIHCLPGIYAPKLNPMGPPEIDPRSGLPINEEVFPVSIGNRISLQGTSALDTIFDARPFLRGITIPAMPPPTVDLVPYLPVAQPPKLRGSLYVNDL